MLMAADLRQVSVKVAQKLSFSNPSMQALQSQLLAVQASVMGTNESHTQIQSQIWSTSVMHGPLSLGLTINPLDTQDPIAHIFAGHKIDMDNFSLTDGLDRGNHVLIKVQTHT